MEKSFIETKSNIGICKVQFTKYTNFTILHLAGFIQSNWLIGNPLQKNENLYIGWFQPKIINPLFILGEEYEFKYGIKIEIKIVLKSLMFGFLLHIKKALEFRPHIYAQRKKKWFITSC